MSNAVTKEEPPVQTSESQALADIVAWSKDCPAWQQDALRRLFTSEKLTSSDIEELISLCKGQSSAVALNEGDLRDPAAGLSAVTLKSLSDLNHVNALATEETLSFSQTGLTIVYGDNGSGKSGYARVLKKACRARISKQDKKILPDIYEPNPGSPSAKIEYWNNGQKSSTSWVQDQPSLPILSAISVFDSQTANVHVDQTNDVAYTPLPLKLLGSLAETCKLMKKKLEAEVEQIERQTPQALQRPTCKPDTKVSQFLLNLSCKSSATELNSLAKVTPTEQKRYDKLASDLANDPSKAATIVLRLKQKIEAFITKIEQLQNSTSEETFDLLREQANALKAAREASKSASTSLFSNEPIPNIGTDAWVQLWEAARAFSEREAYPQKEFPVTDSESVCVLCQQPIKPETATRLNAFEAFIKNDSKRREAKAKTKYLETLSKFRSSKILIAELTPLIAAIRDELEAPELAAKTRRSILLTLWRHRKINRLHYSEDKSPTIPDGEEPPFEELKAHIDKLAEHAKSLNSASGSDARKALIKERDELAARIWLNTIKDDVTAEIERRKVITTLKAFLKQTSTHKITTKSTEIAEQLVTDALRAKFVNEVARLGVADLAVELQRVKSKYGTPNFKVALTRKPDANVGDILSEGEHRCVALAAFLAELATSYSRSAIVFDDPVSSLDHMHRQGVAKRLIEESKDRQIVVFSHDIAFLFQLDQARKEIDPTLAISYRSVSKGSGKAGYCNPEPPFKAQPIKDVIASMRNWLKSSKIQHERGNQAAWETTVRGIQQKLRDSWERAVEEVISPVFIRLSDKVKTPGLSKLTVVTLNDCEEMRKAYGRCSALLHSEAVSLNNPLPSPDTVEKEIDALDTWLDSIQQRQNSV